MRSLTGLVLFVLMSASIFLVNGFSINDLNVTINTSEWNKEYMEGNWIISGNQSNVNTDIVLWIKLTNNLLLFDSSTNNIIGYMSVNKYNDNNYILKIFNETYNQIISIIDNLSYYTILDDDYIIAITSLVNDSTSQYSVYDKNDLLIANILKEESGISKLQNNSSWTVFFNSQNEDLLNNPEMRWIICILATYNSLRDYFYLIDINPINSPIVSGILSSSKNDNNLIIILTVVLSSLFLLIIFLIIYLTRIKNTNNKDIKYDRLY